MFDKKINILFIDDTIEKHAIQKCFFKIKINKAALNGYHVYMFVKTNFRMVSISDGSLHVMDTDSLRVF